MLIVANVAVFILEVSQGDTRGFILEYGLVPTDTPLIGDKTHTFFTNMFLFPNSLIITFVPLLFLPLLIPVPAIIFIGIWFLGQFLSGTSSLLLGETGAGIAFWAHIGGFLGGLAIYRVLYKKQAAGISYAFQMMENAFYPKFFGFLYMYIE
jgi:membrane associated rhomboid family serine protease